MTLLIVNDEIMTAETMKKEIVWSDYGIDAVYTAYDVRAAKNVLQNFTVDILLCDIEMPGENGIDLLAWIRQNAIISECIFLTCHANFKYAQNAIALGCQDYILIPAKYEDIGRSVKKVVDRIMKRDEERKLQQYGEQFLKEQVNEVSQKHGEVHDPAELAQHVHTYIMQNLSRESLSVKEISKQFFLHPVYLNRIYKKEQGISISQFIITERMKLAGELLKSGKLQVYAVAEATGYSSYQNFNLAFKKYYGCSPSQFANKPLL